MTGGMCKNCASWSSTDQVWGHCTHIESDYPSADPKNRASINLCTYDGTADLWTREDFGCREWSSLRATLKRITEAERTKVSSQASGHDRVEPMTPPTLSPTEYAILRNLVVGREVTTIPERLVELGFVRSEKLKQMPDRLKLIWAPTKLGRLHIARSEE